MRAAAREGLPPPEAVRRVLVVAWGLFGDAVVKLPALAGLAARFPAAALTVWTDAAVADVFRGQPFVHALWEFSGRGRGLAHAFAHLAWFAPVRRGRFDLVVDLYGSRASARFVRLSGARWRAGRNRPAVARHYGLLPPDEARRAGTRPLPEIYSAVAHAVGADVRAPYVPLALDVEHRVRARRLAAALPGPGPLVLLNPATSNAAKTWPAERLGALAAALHADGARVAVLRNPDRPALQSAVVAAAGPAAVALPLLGIKDVAALLTHAELLVTGDTGVMHLAAAHGTPSVVIAGATAPVTFVALPALQTALFHADACDERTPAHDCALQRRCAHVSCIRRVQVDEVLGACRARLWPALRAERG